MAMRLLQWKRDRKTGEYSAYIGLIMGRLIPRDGKWQAHVFWPGHTFMSNPGAFQVVKTFAAREFRRAHADLGYAR